MSKQTLTWSNLEGLLCQYGTQIRNPNIEIRNNIKIQISNDQNISGT